MRYLKWLEGMLGALFLMGVLLPYFVGVYFERTYPHLLSVYHPFKTLSFQLVEYKRGWWYSEAVIKVTDFSSAFPAAPQNILIKQTIEHGPLFYRFNVDLPSHSGLVALHTVLTLPNSFVVPPQEGIITFLGNYRENFHLSGGHFSYTQDPWLMTYANVEGNFFVGAHTVKLSLKCPALTIADRSTFLLSLQGISLQAIMTEKEDVLSFSKQVDIEKGFWNKASLGTLHYQMALNNINTRGFFDLIENFFLIKNRGELYKSQLKDKMLLLLPNLISLNSGGYFIFTSSIPHYGDTLINMHLTWPPELNYLPFSMEELSENLQWQLKIRLPKTLVDDLIHYTLIQFNHPLAEENDIQEQLKKAISSKYIIQDEKYDSVTIEKKQETFTANGQIIN